MTGIVERLRARQAHWAGQPDYYGGDLFKDAADRIELLQAALREALPEVEESCRFFRDTQAEPRRILNAEAVLNTIRAALGGGR